MKYIAKLVPLSSSEDSSVGYLFKKTRARYTGKSLELVEPVIIWLQANVSDWMIVKETRKAVTVRFKNEEDLVLCKLKFPDYVKSKG